MAWVNVGNIKGPSGGAVAKVWLQGHTWTVGGELTAGLNVPPFYVPVGSGQAVKVVGVRAKLRAGTNVAVTLTRNGSAVGTAQTVTVAGINITLDQALSNGDLLGLTIGTPSGTPTDLTYTAVLQHTV